MDHYALLVMLIILLAPIAIFSWVIVGGLLIDKLRKTLGKEQPKKQEELVRSDEWDFNYDSCNFNRIKSSHQTLVEELLRGIGHELPDKPSLIPGVEQRLKMQLLLHFEEVFELADACGITVSVTGASSNGHVGFAACPRKIDEKDLILQQTGKADLIAIADAESDIQVISTGGLSFCGIADTTILREVDKNNLLKLKNGHKDEKTGKWIKPVDHPKPDIKKRLIEQGAEL